ncbi:hypothetical protein J7T55_001398 [Diaporthe amygdali]|uniref:uncharacterized protein n=1 Tax=Phomopsis amygdali TaxID=1214568 RepID=UPI0022FF0455|nr:uncharacterized protein J7T55_001398 [Diaporthe amygdali]KAJ0114991.1 hypothetical protein J7T55_001398 [Diaporthe amygdali]
MAEVLGIVGSVIGIAQLAGTIIATGTRLSGILKEMQDIPDEISIRLEQLHMLSLSLQQSEGSSITSIPSLHHARQHCQKCLSGLTHMLEELTDRLERSRGMRRKASIARHLLRKDELAKVERRLSHSVELLTVVNQMYMIHLLESQRLRFIHNNSVGTSVPILQERTEPPLSLEGRRAMSEQRLNSTANSPIGTITVEHSFRKIVKSSWPKSTWELGLAYITGSLQLEFYQSPSSDITCRASASSDDKLSYHEKADQSVLGVPKARIKISLPTWWSGKVIEALLYRSQVGWMQLLRTRNNLAYSRELYDRVLGNIESGNLAELVKQFDQRQLAPWDELWSGWNLFAANGTYAHFFWIEEWKHIWISAYIREYQPPRRRSRYHINDVVVAARFDSWTGDQRLLDYQRLIKETDQNDALVLSLLSHWKGSLVSFTNVRRSVWSDDEFYSKRFLRKRMQLTTGLVLNGPVIAKRNTDVIPITRFALEQAGSWTQASIDLSISSNRGETLLHGIAGVIGLLRGQEPVEEWLRLSIDVVKNSSLRHICQASAISRGPDLETPLLRLIQRSFDPGFPFCCQMVNQGSLRKRVQRCETTISSWLGGLLVAGVDLFRYGQEEAHAHVNAPGVRREFGLDFSCDDAISHNWWGHIRLIKFDFGKSPSQWKFWWSEMTDQFAGHFWHMVEEQEISNLRVPGAWVDDDFPTGV